MLAFWPLGAAVAEVHADLIDQVMSQADYLPADHMQPWKNYFSDRLHEWPQLRQFMAARDGWYRETINQLLVDKAETSTTQ
jgi:hypothetical protein